MGVARANMDYNNIALVIAPKFNHFRNAVRLLSSTKSCWENAKKSLWWRRVYDEMQRVTIALRSTRFTRRGNSAFSAFSDIHWSPHGIFIRSLPYEPELSPDAYAWKLLDSFGIPISWIVDVISCTDHNTDHYIKFPNPVYYKDNILDIVAKHANGKKLLFQLCCNDISVYRHIDRKYHTEELCMLALKDRDNILIACPNQLGVHTPALYSKLMSLRDFDLENVLSILSHCQCEYTHVEEEEKKRRIHIAHLAEILRDPQAFCRSQRLTPVYREYMIDHHPVDAITYLPSITTFECIRAAKVYRKIHAGDGDWRLSLLCRCTDALRKEVLLDLFFPSTKTTTTTKRRKI